MASAACGEVLYRAMQSEGAAEVADIQADLGLEATRIGSGVHLVPLSTRDSKDVLYPVHPVGQCPEQLFRVIDIHI